MARKYKLAAVAGLAVLMVVGLLAGQALAQTGTPTASGMMGGNTGMMSGTAGVTSAGTVTPTMPGRNMMGGTAGGMMGSSTGVTGTQPFSGMMGGTQGVPYGGSGYGMMGNGAYGNGMMGNGMMGNGMMGNGMMGNGMMGNGMMGVTAGWSDPSAKPLTVDQAEAAAQKYLQGLPNNAGANLAPMEVMEFSNGFYVAVADKTTNSGALELLVDRYDGTVSPEPGPNMMWNTKYGMMSGQQSGMMGGMMGVWTPSTGVPTVSAQQARMNAQQFLALKFPTAKLPEDMMTFSGYYTLDFEVNGQPAGMLSVNAYTGQVWYHTWHGQFLSERSMQAAS